MNFLLFVIFLVPAYVLVIKRVIENWGATAAEIQTAYPGDELIPDRQGKTIRATTIHAPMEAVWPWIAQIGQGRGGFYSYDWLENRLGMDIHSADQILPEHQNPQLGDAIRLTKNGPVYKIAALVPGRLLILRMVDQKTLEFPDPSAPDYYDATWGFILEPVDAQTTRLLVRGQGAANSLSGRIINHIIVPIAFIMEERMLRGVKSRAEAAHNPPVA